MTAARMNGRWDRGVFHAESARAISTACREASDWNTEDLQKGCLVLGVPMAAPHKNGSMSGPSENGSAAGGVREKLYSATTA